MSAPAASRRRELLDELALAHAEELRQLLDVALGDPDLGDAAAIRALRAVDLGLNLLAEAPQAPVRMAVVFQIGAKPRSSRLFSAVRAGESGPDR